ncbi:MAG TPA: glycoside hydrolase family 2 [Lachnospiraceae bacterium]|nr:glycoside hydrolase family 2 [Lachnospiraceae bacterium]HCA70581.1 glycoside hydrolase family 2 [Lachnospiraceae bacterium]
MKNYIKDYPRPQFVRKNWANLNGVWDFSFDDGKLGETEKWYEIFPIDKTILVPFTYETKLSSIQEDADYDTVDYHDTVWYHRKLSVDGKKLAESKLLLHFEGSDFMTKVWVNGKLAGSHRGGYSRFSFDISTIVSDGENDVVVKVEDSCDASQPRGKQRWKKENFGCWYVQTTGIWKTVWMEYVPKVRLDRVKITPLLDEQAVELEFDVQADHYGEELSVEAVITFEGSFVNKGVFAIPSKRVITKLKVAVAEKQDLHDIQTWSPEKPNLYDLELRVIYRDKVCDEVGSYFGMREIRIDKNNILLNGRPLYQRLILDQGYWKDSHLTPPSEEALIEDIDKIQRLGFNGLRKHQKIEDERFLYWCDVKGMLVWSEAPAAYEFTDDAIEEFTREWMEIVRQNYNHPCIITWTPINESWGVPNVETDISQQRFTEAIYYITKSFDQYRPVIVNDGWEHTISDIITLHDYEESGLDFFKRYNECKEQILTTEVYHNKHKSAFANGYSYRGQPIIISEYGGIAFDNDNRGWGYGNKVQSEEQFLTRFDEITTAIKNTTYVCGYCYTQVSDVQQEINGLLDSDRNFKVDPERIREINTRETGYLLA